MPVAMSSAETQPARALGMTAPPVLNFSEEALFALAKQLVPQLRAMLSPAYLPPAQRDSCPKKRYGVGFLCRRGCDNDTKGRRA